MLPVDARIFGARDLSRAVSNSQIIPREESGEEPFCYFRESQGSRERPGNSVSRGNRHFVCQEFSLRERLSLAEDERNDGDKGVATLMDGIDKHFSHGRYPGAAPAR